MRVAFIITVVKVNQEMSMRSLSRVLVWCGLILGLSLPAQAQIVGGPQPGRVVTVLPAEPCAYTVRQDSVYLTLVGTYDCVEGAWKKRPISDDVVPVTGLGSGVGTWFATPSSANLATAVTDETGSGALVFGTSPALTGPITLTGATGSSALTVAGGTQTASFPAQAITQTWNNASVVFAAQTINVTNTASDVSSLLADWKVGGTSVWQFNRTGILLFGGSLQQGIDGASAGSLFLTTGGTKSAELRSAGSVLQINSTWGFGWTSGTVSGSSLDTVLRRGGAAATVQLGTDTNGAAVSQTIQAANGITGTDRTGGNVIIQSGKGTGAGAVSQILFKTPTVLASGTTAQSLTTRVTVDVNGLSVEALKTTGAAGGKKMVCVDTSTGILYASSSDTGCAN